MQFLLSLLQWICLIPVIGGSLYTILCLFAVLRFRTRPPQKPLYSFSDWPAVTILKPVRGLEKNQRANFRSACMQDYPHYQVVFSVQDSHDPVIPLLKEIQDEFGSEKVSIAIKNLQAGPNGKINNLLGALLYARHDILVISDSDVNLRPDYLKTIIAPLADPEVGCVCTLYKAICADRWFEKMELLTFNADFIPSVVFAHVSGASNFCLGCSIAIHSSMLEEIGGLETFADYLVEDYEIGQRIWKSGKKITIVPYFIDIVVDLKNFSQWWDHQVSWDQKTYTARPFGFLASVLIRSIPFALLFGMFRLGDIVGLAILAGALGLRLLTASIILGWGFKDDEGLKSLAFLPLRDMAALITWFLAVTKRTINWRGTKFILTRNGRLRPRE